MVNRHRGEISAKFDDKEYCLCLTLGALAELEAAFGVADISALAERFSSGKLAANDMVKVIGAGLRGAGHTFGDDDVRSMQVQNGVLGFARIVSDLLTATFGGRGDASGQSD